MPLDLRYFRRSDCVTDQCLVLEEVVDSQYRRSTEISRREIQTHEASQDRS
jgi:hypothetical protein